MCSFLIACPKCIVTLHNSFLNFWLEKIKNFTYVKNSKDVFRCIKKKTVYQQNYRNIY